MIYWWKATKSDQHGNPILRLWAVCFSFMRVCKPAKRQKDMSQFSSVHKRAWHMLSSIPPSRVNHRSPTAIFSAKNKAAANHTLNLHPSGHVCFWVVQFIWISFNPWSLFSCFADICCIRSMTLSSQCYFSGFQGVPVSWELLMNLKVRLHSLWLLSSVASTALENKLILTGAISSENDSGGVWEFSSLHKSVLSHFYFNGCWSNLTCFITWWSCGSAGF